MKIDHIDKQIIQALYIDSRNSFANIGKELGLSGPAVGERVRRLQEKGIIESFTVSLNHKKLGYNLSAMIRIKPRSAHLKTVEQLIFEQGRFVQCHRVTGEDCFVAMLELTDISELDDVLYDLHEFAETNTSIIKSSLVANRQPPLMLHKD